MCSTRGAVCLKLACWRQVLLRESVAEAAAFGPSRLKKFKLSLSELPLPISQAIEELGLSAGPPPLPAGTALTD